MSLEYGMLEMYSKAISVFRAELYIGESEELCFGIANAYWNIEEIASAEQPYIRTLELNPDNVDAESNLSNLRSEK